MESMTQTNGGTEMKIEVKTMDARPGLLFSRQARNGQTLRYRVSRVFEVAGVWCVQFFRLKANGNTYGNPRATPFGTLQRMYRLDGYDE